MIELKGYKFNKIEFDNNAANGTQLKLQNQFKYNVNYRDGDNKCLGTLEFRVVDSEMNPFEIRIEMVAEFTYDADDDKADIHVESFSQMFPFIRQAIHSLTSMSGMPGLLVPIVTIDRDSVQVGKPQNDDEDDDEGVLN